MKRSHVLALCAAAAAVVAACGGGSDDHAATDGVPPVATQSVPDFMDYMKRLVASNGDTLEAFDVSNVTPPADDTAEPTPVD